MAEGAVDPLDLGLTRIPGGWLVREVGPWSIQVVDRLSCARILAVHQDDLADQPSAYWCYYGDLKLTAAILAAVAWDGRLDSAPVGAQRAYDGRSSLHHP